MNNVIRYSIKISTFHQNLIYMAEKNKKSGRGGARPGAGRPRKQEGSKLYSFRASGEIARFLDAQEQRTEFIKECIDRSMMESEPYFSQIGTASLVSTK